MTGSTNKMKKLLLICLLVIGFCNHATAQYNNFNRGGWNNMQSFNRGGWNNMQSFNRGGWGNNNFNRQYYPTLSGTGRTPVRHYGNNVNNNQQGQQQNNGIPASTENRGANLTFNNGYPYGQRQAQTGGYYRVDTKRNVWLFVPRPGLIK